MSQSILETERLHSAVICEEFNKLFNVADFVADGFTHCRFSSQELGGSEFILIDEAEYSSLLQEIASDNSNPEPSVWEISEEWDKLPKITLDEQVYAALYQP